MNSELQIRVFDSVMEKDNIMIICHKNPDGDALGTAFALLQVLKNAGKRAFVACSDPVPPRMKFIADEQDNLDVIFEPDCIVAVDVATKDLIGEKLSVYEDRVDFCIDHHHTNTGYAKQTIVCADASSTGELLFDILDVSNIKINDYIAEKLYTAISFDTGCFRFANVKPHTHIVAAKLLEYDFDFEDINRRLFDIASLEQLQIETAVISGVERYKNNTITMLTLTQQMLKDSGSENIDIDGLSSITRRIEGTKMGIAVRELSDGLIKVSLRSLDDKIDVSKIAAVFGGGGHKRASGCSFSVPVDEAKKQLLKAVFKYWDENQIN